MKVVRGADDELVSVHDGLLSSSDNSAAIKFGSVDEINYIYVMEMTKKLHHKYVCETKLK